MSTIAAIDAKANELGITAEPREKQYLNFCARAGNLYFTSGHVSTVTGTLGVDLTVEQGREAALQSIKELLTSVRIENGTLSNLRVVRVMACVRATNDFVQHGAVIDAASDLIHDLFGDDLGFHARSALGFASLPRGAAVEIEGIFEIISA